MKKLLLILLLTVTPFVHASNLFNEETTMSFTLKADFKMLERERNKNTQYPAELISDNRVIPIELEVRGNNRLKKSVCRHAPLRLLFDKKSVDDTVFDKQRKLKLVVKCSGSDIYEDYIRTEYLVYKMLNHLTDMSFRVRWAAITYQQSDDAEETEIRPGFLIEEKRRIEKRLDLDDIKLPRVSHHHLDPELTSLIDVFQFMIGNADYSLLEGEGEGEDKEACCHNAKLLGKDRQTPYFPIAYDFDNAGVINARYAEPNPALKISHVTQRSYRGFCIHNNILADTTARLKAEKDTLLALISNDPILSKRGKKRALNYLEDFFEILDSDRKTNRFLTNQCRG